MYGYQKKKKKDNKERYCKKIVEAASHYSKVAERKIIYIYIDSDSKMQEVAINFGINNFMHLTGMKCSISKQNRNTISSKNFYTQALNDDLDHTLLIGADKHETDLKMEIIDCLQYLLSCNHMRASIQNVVFLKDTLHGHVNAKKAIVGLHNTPTFRTPKSLRNPRTHKAPKNHKVICIYEPSQGNKPYTILCETEDFKNFTKKKPYIFK